MKFKIENRTLKVGLNILVMLVIIILLHLFWGRWILGNLENEKERSAELLERLTEMENSIRRYPDPEKNMDEIKKTNEDLLKKLISKEELPRIIKQLTQLAKKHGEMRITSIKSIEDKNLVKMSLPQGVSKVYLRLAVEVSYKSLGEYLREMEELPMILTVEDLTMERPVEIEDETSPKSKDENKILVNILISSYTIWE